MPQAIKTFILYEVPLFLWMGMIYKLSSIPAKGLMPMPSEQALWLAHKIAHLVEYSVLGFLLTNVGVKRFGGSSRNTLCLGVLVLGVIYASLDEWHQTFVPGRSGSMIDATLDVVYVGFGFIIFRRLLTMLGKR